MTSTQTTSEAAFAQESLTMHRIALVAVPITISCVGLLAIAAVGVIGGLLSAAVILGWSQLAGL